MYHFHAALICLSVIVKDTTVGINPILLGRLSSLKYSVRCSKSRLSVTFYWAFFRKAQAGGFKDTTTAFVWEVSV